MQYDVRQGLSDNGLGNLHHMLQKCLDSKLLCVCHEVMKPVSHMHALL